MPGNNMPARDHGHALRRDLHLTAATTGKPDTDADTGGGAHAR